jgi:Tfp pilus assembly protein PilO
MNGSKNITNLMIIIAICSIGGIIFGARLLFPKFQEFQTINKAIEVQKKDLENKQQYIVKLKDVEAQVKEYQSEIAKIDIALPNEPSVPSIFDFLQKVISQSGLVASGMGGFSVTDSVNYPGLKEINMTFSVAGSYESFKNFINILERSSRMIDVGLISFSGSAVDQEAKNQSKDMFSFGLTIKVHSY